MPLNVRSKPLNVRSEALNVRSETLNVRSEPLNEDFIREKKQFHHNLKTPLRLLAHLSRRLQTCHV